jgi:hypothetical protein
MGLSMLLIAFLSCSMSFLILSMLKYCNCKEYSIYSVGCSLVFWFIVLALSWLSILRKFLLGFLPHESFRG